MSNVIAFPSPRAPNPPRRIIGEAIDGAIRLEFPWEMPALTLTVEQAERWCELLPVLIATAKAQRAEGA